MALTEVDAARLNDNVFNTVGPFKNRIINGDMRIDQRNAGASVTPNSAFTLDRWESTTTQNSKYTVQQNAGSVTPPTGFINYLGVTSSSAYSVTSSDTFLIAQQIEGLNIGDLAWGTASAVSVTVSFWVRSSLTGTFGGALTNSAGNRSYPFSYSISAANTWEYKTVTVPGDTSGTWLTTNGVGIRLRFGLGSGSNFTATANTWGATNAVQPTGSTSVVGTNGATFYITGVQLEAGTVATPFERRSYGQELALCQRYCEVISPIYLPGTYDGSVFRGGRLSFAVTKRASPDSSVSGNQAQWAIPGLNAFSAASNTSFSVSTTTTGFFVFQTRQAGGGTPTVGNFYLLESAPTITFASEL